MTVDEALPGRLLLVTESPADGAALAAGFLDVHLVSPDELKGALEDQPFPCVGIAALRSDGALARVARELLAHAPEDVTVLLEASDRIGLPGLAEDPLALEGLALDRVEVVAGVPCLVLRPKPGAEAPDLSLLADYLGTLVAVREGAGLHVLTGELGEFPEHPPGEVPGVEQGAAAGTNAFVGRYRAGGLAQQVRRVGLVGGAAVLVLAVQLGLGLSVAKIADERQAVAAALALLLPVLLCLAYLIRGQRRLAKAISRVSSGQKRASTASRRRDDQRGDAMAELAAAVERLARKVEVVEVSAVDSARSLADLARQLRERP